MKKGIKIVLDIVFWVFIVAVVVFSLVYMKAQKEGTQKPIFGHMFYTVLTGSMEPTIKTGSLIIDKVVKTDELEKGDIITFKVPESNAVVTHRINDVIKNGDAVEFETKGDANNAVDIAHVPSENVIGKVQKWVPGIGNFIMKIKSLFK